MPTFQFVSYVDCDDLEKKLFSFPWRFWVPLFEGRHRLFLTISLILSILFITYEPLLSYRITLSDFGYDFFGESVSSYLAFCTFIISSRTQHFNHTLCSHTSLFSLEVFQRPVFFVNLGLAIECFSALTYDCLLSRFLSFSCLRTFSSNSLRKGRYSQSLHMKISFSVIKYDCLVGVQRMYFPLEFLALPQCLLVLTSV